MSYDQQLHFNNFGQNTSTNTHRATRNDIRLAVNDMYPQSPYDNAAAAQSTNVYVYANGCVVGMIQSFTVTEQRTINKLQSLGVEGVVQAVPSNTNGGTLNVNRIALYESQMWNGLGLTTNGVPFNEVGSKTYEEKDGTSQMWDTPTWRFDNEGHKTNTRLIFKTLKDQKVPLEIQTRTRREGSDDVYYTETYIDCWIQNYSKSYTVQNITVSESATLSYADVY